MTQQKATITDYQLIDHGVGRVSILSRVHPRPNEIDIGGQAVARHCGDSGIKREEYSSLIP